MRIGPDLKNHWMFYFKPLMRRICKRDFLHFGDNSEVRPGAYVFDPSTISIGNNVVIRPLSVLQGNIVIEDDVLIGMGVHIYTQNHEFNNRLKPIIFQGHSLVRKVVLKRGCWIGANSVILKGVTIGVNAVVGAGSVVTKDVRDFSIVAGNPAREI